MLSLTTQGTFLALQLLVRTLSFQTQRYRDESSKRTAINDTNASLRMTMHYTTQTNDPTKEAVPTTTRPSSPKKMSVQRCAHLYLAAAAQRNNKGGGYQTNPKQNRTHPNAYILEWVSPNLL